MFFINLMLLLVVLLSLGVVLLLVRTYVEPKSFQNMSLIPQYRVVSVLLLLMNLLLLVYLNSQVVATSGNSRSLTEIPTEFTTGLTT